MKLSTLNYLKSESWGLEVFPMFFITKGAVFVEHRVS